MITTCATGPSGWIFTSSSGRSWWSCAAGVHIKTNSDHFLKRFIFYWVPVIIWAGFIFFLSSYANPMKSPLVTSIQAEANSIDIPNVSIRPLLPKIGLADLAKIVNHSEFTRRTFHLFLYLILGYLVHRALIVSTVRHPFWAAVIACSFYGLSDEIHQLFVPGRNFQWFDIAFDIFGALLGILLYYLMVNFITNRHSIHAINGSKPGI